MRQVGRGDFNGSFPPGDGRQRREERGVLPGVAQGTARVEDHSGPHKQLNKTEKCAIAALPMSCMEQAKRARKRRSARDVTSVQRTLNPACARALPLL